MKRKPPLFQARRKCRNISRIPARKNEVNFQHFVYNFFESLPQHQDDRVVDAKNQFFIGCFKSMSYF